MDCFRRNRMSWNAMSLNDHLVLRSAGIFWDLLAGLRKGIFFPPVSPDFCFQTNLGKTGCDETLAFTLSWEGRAGFSLTMNFVLVASLPSPTFIFPSTKRMHCSNKEPLQTGTMENQGWDIPHSTRRQVILKKHSRSLGSWSSWCAGETMALINPRFFSF